MAAQVNHWKEYLRMIALEKSKVQFLDLPRDEEPQDVSDVYLPLVVKTHKEATSATGSSGTRSRRLTESAQQGVAAHTDLEVGDPAQDLEGLLCPVGRKRVRCLLLSPPGGGKTMTCHQILNLWAGGKSFKHFKAVVYLTGKEDQRVCTSKVGEFLALNDSEPTDRKSLTERLIQSHVASHGEELLIILDAADESSSDSLFKDGGILATLFSPAKSLSSGLGKLTDASVIVTSRPCPASDYLVQGGDCTAVLWLCGFTDYNLQQLLRKRLGEEQSKCLWHELNRPDHEQLKDAIVKVPFLAAMIAVVYEENEALPSTVAEIYEIIQENLFNRRKPGTETECSLNIRALDGVAYQHLRKNEADITEDNIIQSGQATCKLSAKLVDVGILVKNPKRVSLGSQITYSFSHPSWHDFMAGRAVADQPNVLSDAAKKIGFGNHRTFFWRVVAGLMSDAESLALLLEVMRKSKDQTGLFTTSARIFFMDCIVEWTSCKGDRELKLRKVSERLKKALCSSDEKRLDFQGHNFNKKDASAMKLAVECLQISAVSLRSCVIEMDHCMEMGELFVKLTHFTVEYVNFKDNARSFADLIKHFSQLVWLEFNNCELGRLHAPALKHLLLRNRKLKTLYLVANNLQTSDVLTVCEGITEGSLLHTLMLHGNGLGSDFDGDEVGRALVNAKKLKSVGFTRNSLSNKHLELFLPHLVDHSHLEDIWLRRNNFDNHSLDHIGSFLRQRSEHLSTLCLPTDGTSDKLSNDKSVRKSSVTIHLENNEITESGLHRLASSLPDTCGDTIRWNGQVVMLGKACVEVYEEGLQLTHVQGSLGEAWVNHYSMNDGTVGCAFKGSQARDFVLDRNDIGDEGAKSLAEGLKSNMNIRTLLLANNNIGLAGFLFILDTLVSHPLEVLAIAENPIFKYVPQEHAVLHVNNSLRYLDLSATCMATEHGCRLVQLLESHQTLHFLNLSNNHLGDKFAVSLSMCLLKKTALSLIELSFTDITDSGAHTLVCAARQKDVQARVCCIWLGGNEISTRLLRLPLVDGELKSLPVGTILELIPSPK